MDATGETLKGAYIGGYSDSAQNMRLIGPTALSSGSQPQYRSLSAVEEKKIGSDYTDYKKTSTEVNKVIESLESHSILREEPAQSGIKEVSSEYKGGLISCYHGMIRAMQIYASVIGKNIYIYEIAVGKDTTKVSSCFPCATFMQSVKQPASSVHLGRGDYWDIPEDNNQRRDWANNIKKWYEAGYEHLKTKKGFNKSGLPEKMDEKCALFIESLTFPSSFTDKITNALK